MEFSEQIKRWVVLDNHLKTLSDKTKELRNEKSAITENILEHVEANQLSNAVVKVSDGRIKFIKTTQYSPLTFKHVETCLKKCIRDDDDVKKIISLIKDTRQTNIVSDIKRTYVDASTK